LTLIVALVLTSCANQKSTKQAQISKPIAAQQETQSTQIKASQYIALAKKQSGEQSYQLLIKATQQFVNEQNYEKALWLANQLTPLQQNDNQSYELTLFKAISLYQLNFVGQAYEQLVKADEIKAAAKLAHTYDYFDLLSQVQQTRQLYVASLNAQLNAFKLNSAATDEDIYDIWLSLINLSQWQVTQLVKLNPTSVKGWRQLLGYAHKFGDDSQQFARYIKQWQRSFPTHPGHRIVEKIQETNITASVNNNVIAVILPLSGKQKAAGNAAQQGILAAYQQHKDKQLHFIDSNKVAIDTLQTTFDELNVEQVIGPLLKPNVERYIEMAYQLPTLLLNLPSTVQLPEHYSALSMRPEDEAIQAATTLSSRSYQHPLIISTKDNVSQRITQSFVEQWQLITGEAPEVIYLDQPNKMQDELKESLDVHLSQERINQLKVRMRQNIKTEARNRRDIDMIYLVGSPKDSRLLKPYIDVNISPFAELVPIFSSSRSHGTNTNESDNRDLSGLVFTEIPWLLPSKQQNRALVQTSKQLWPKRTESLEKIFAMGFDSYALASKLPAMKQLPYVRHYGQTGTLKLNDDNILTRSLLWGRYRKDRVQEIAFE